MKKNQRDHNGRALKFAETGMGRRRSRKMLARKIMACGMTASAAAQIRLIQGEKAVTAFQKLGKAFAIAQVADRAKILDLNYSTTQAQPECKSSPNHQ